LGSGKRIEKGEALEVLGKGKREGLKEEAGGVGKG